MSYRSTLRTVLDELEYALGAQIVISSKFLKVRSRKVIPFRLTPEGPVGPRLYVRVKRQVPFTFAEREFATAVVNGFTGLWGEIENGGNASERQEVAIRVATMDIAVASYLSQGRSMFKNIETLLSWFKELCFKKYEGEQVKTGVFVGNNSFPHVKRSRTDGVQFETVQLDSVPINRKLLNDVACHRFVDGISACYVADSNLNLKGYFAVHENKLDIFERLSGTTIEKLGNSLNADTNAGFYFYIGITTCGDIEIVLPSSNVRIMYRGGRWLFFDSTSLTNAIYFDEDENLSMQDDFAWKILYGISKIRKGAALLRLTEPNNVLKDRVLCAGHISISKIFDSLREAVQEPELSFLALTGELQRILLTDGLTVVDRKFDKLLDCNMIVNTASAEGDEGEERKDSVSGGGRTTAVRAASKFGIGIKVSEDGPISIFRDGEEAPFYTFG